MYDSHLIFLDKISITSFGGGDEMNPYRIYNIMIPISIFLDKISRIEPHSELTIPYHYGGGVG
jgi:hypothetical protein